MKGYFGTDVPTPAKVGEGTAAYDPKTIEKLMNHTPWGKLIDANVFGVIELLPPVGKGENPPGGLIVEPITVEVLLERA